MSRLPPLKILPLLALFYCLLLSGSAFAAAHVQPITVTLPESLLREAIASVVPIQIDPHVHSMRGEIEVKNISNLQISKGRIACRMQLEGRHLGVSTNVGGHILNLNIGSLSVDVNTDSALRFDAQKQILYIRPTVKSSSATQGQADSLISMFNGNELPIALQKLQPLVSQAGNKMLIINGRITDIVAEQDRLVLKLLPTISTRKVR
ncbi:hypothetical protein JWG39_13835 [Desulforhopalus vacuolatus]|uniref:hypothetical protein n=1 Tax=Desulforhopalus vacuolatus TaxID=40414 RepID=UPI001966CDBB|nr:hypothetical protein [Desulforhopalus vacuolatus]MBM9520895.1 hypothetical protein [Desulforhopalus vacuolatus]